MDKSNEQWLKLVNVNMLQTFSTPERASSGTMAFWLKIIDCQADEGIITNFQTKDGGTSGLRLTCPSATEIKYWNIPSRRMTIQAESYFYQF